MTASCGVVVKLGLAAFIDEMNGRCLHPVRSLSLGKSAPESDGRKGRAAEGAARCQTAQFEVVLPPRRQRRRSQAFGFLLSLLQSFVRHVACFCGPLLTDMSRSTVSLQWPDEKEMWVALVQAPAAAAHEKSLLWYRGLAQRLAGQGAERIRQHLARCVVGSKPVCCPLGSLH